ncbi:MAG: hypothetical protein QOI34_1473 [Verrucomicrobiota bacterium]
MRETMSHPALRLRSALVRSTTVGAFLVNFFFALWLAATPSVHERIHAVANTSMHECAVTFFSAANFEGSAPNLPRIEPISDSGCPAFLFNRISASRISTIASILEHAPPANS